MSRKWFPNTPLGAFTPFLLLYLCLVLYLHTDTMYGDEARYWEFAQNLLQGFYSPPAPDINLWNGPGYPLFLLPFAVLGLPLLAITLANAVLYWASVLLLYHSLLGYVSRRTALLLSLFWAGYYIAFQELPSLLSEPLTLFLVTAIAYCWSRAFREASTRWMVVAGLLLGWLTLTKIIFGYVVLVLLAGSVLYAGISRTANARRLAYCFGVAFLLCVPYLLYTYSLTGRVLYWGNSGGMSLYWMSTPVEGEYGDWNNETFTANCGLPNMPCSAPLLAVHHQADIAYVSQFVGVAKDDAYKRIAIDNIKAHPVKYVRNWLANIGRLLFGIPASYFYQREATLARILPNGVLLTFMLIAAVPTIRSWRRVALEIRILVLLLLLYLGASSLLSAYPRQFYVVVPMLLLWIGYVLERSLRISLQIGSAGEAGCAKPPATGKECNLTFL
ncbi:ArnT family glycosyltransferase [Cesiribacter andamanensis]|nr:glycosyltransferase family 39 protein [Cesiribacter andamanensis]